MARVTAENRSGLSGKMDGMVYVNLNGQTYTRKLPTYKKDSTTPGMKRNQQRFKMVNEFCAQFKDSVIAQIWNGRDERMSGYSLFLKTNMPAFGPDGTLVDAQKIMLSTGNVSFPPGLEATRSQTDETRIDVSWPREMTVGGLHSKDELMVVSEVDGVYSDIISTGIKRNDLQGSFELPAYPLPQAPRPLHVFLFFTSYDHRDYSKSVCFEV